MFKIEKDRWVTKKSLDPRLDVQGTLFWNSMNQITKEEKIIEY